jgi:hypothetical protein
MYPIGKAVINKAVINKAVNSKQFRDGIKASSRPHGTVSSREEHVELQGAHKARNSFTPA